MAFVPRNGHHALQPCRYLLSSPKLSPLRMATSRSSFSTTRLTRSSQRSELSSHHPASLLATPTWSVRSLVPSSRSPDSCDISALNPSQLPHLLRLSALPLPTDAAEEGRMITTLQSQLHFVRDVQNVDAARVAPLRSIRDETPSAVTEQTITAQVMEPALAQEDSLGHSKRPRRRKARVDASDVENWNPLDLASQSSGRYYVVRSGKD